MDPAVSARTCVGCGRESLCGVEPRVATRRSGRDERDRERETVSRLRTPRDAALLAVAPAWVKTPVNGSSCDPVR
eukprot:989380-Prymnesium_polylepis.1